MNFLLLLSLAANDLLIVSNKTTDGEETLRKDGKEQLGCSKVMNIACSIVSLMELRDP